MKRNGVPTDVIRYQAKWSPMSKMHDHYAAAVTPAVRSVRGRAEEACGPNQGTIEEVLEKRHQAEATAGVSEGGQRAAGTRVGR